MATLEQRFTVLEDRQRKAELRNSNNFTELGVKIDALGVSIENMVLRVEFQPVRALVFGGVGIVLTAALAAMLGFVIVSNK